MTPRKLFAATLSVFALALGACAYRPPPSEPGVNPLAPYPEGTVDTTHGAKGSQTSPH